MKPGRPPTFRSIPSRGGYEPPSMIPPGMEYGQIFGLPPGRREAEVLRLLTGLGSDAVSVARSLVGARARGYDPVANYLRSRGIANPGSSGHRVWWYEDETRVAVDTPPAISEFIGSFREGTRFQALR